VTEIACPRPFAPICLRKFFDLSLVGIRDKKDSRFKPYNLEIPLPFLKNGDKSGICSVVSQRHVPLAD